MENIDFSVFEVFTIQHCLNIIAACLFFFLLGKFLNFLYHLTYNLVLETQELKRIIVKNKEKKQRKIIENG